MSNATKRRMLVVSSYRRQCGIAQYLEHLEVPLRDWKSWDIQIAALPVDVLKARTAFGREAAKREIAEICQKASQADVVNIQFEPGLFGRTPSEINSRVSDILKSSRKVIVTYHTVPSLDEATLPTSLRSVKQFIQKKRAQSIFKQLFKAVRRDPTKFHHIVHTRRDARRYELMGIDPKTITNMPLSFLAQSQKKAFTSTNSARAEVDELYGLQGKRIIGCFGFLSDYKGIEVAIRALPYLPEDYHLLIVGGLHPEGIVPRTVRLNGIVRSTWVHPIN